MSRTTSPSDGYFIFDAALLHGTEPYDWLQAQPNLRRLYDDLGEQAGTVGPLLIQATPDVIDLAQALAGCGDARRFACGLLICRSSTAVLERHLRQLRHLATHDDQQYYFRCADSRAVQAVWDVLDARQQADMIGPLASWEIITRRGPVQLMPASGSAQPSTPAALPLVLSSMQWHNLLDASRCGQLMEATYDALAGAPSQGDEWQHEQWTAQTIAWLRRLRIDSVPLQVVTNQVMWQTAGIIYLQAPYEAALRDAKVTGRVDRLLAFSRVSRSRSS
jgi:hypothetical protein